MQRKYILLLWQMALLCLTGCLESPEGISPATLGKWSQYSAADGLAADYVTAIYQDKTGLYWFGHAGEGVSTFDGKTFNTLTTADGLTSNTVMSILQDRDDDILFGTSNGLSVLSDGEWGYFPALNGVPITDLFEDDQGRLWMGSDNYGIIYIIDGQIGQVLDNTCSACNYVHGITQTADGRVWFGTNGGLKVLQGDELTLYTTADGLADNNVQSLAVDDWDNLWIGCRQGAFITRYSNGEFEKISLNNDASSLWVTSIAAGKRGDLWFGMVSYGLTKYDGAVMDKIYKGPADDTITKIFKDSDGNLWFGTLYGGVSKYITE